MSNDTNPKQEDEKDVNEALLGNAYPQCPHKKWRYMKLLTVSFIFFVIFMTSTSCPRSDKNKMTESTTPMIRGHWHGDGGKGYGGQHHYHHHHHGYVHGYAYSDSEWPHGHTYDSEYGERSSSRYHGQHSHSYGHDGGDDQNGGWRPNGDHSHGRSGWNPSGDQSLGSGDHSHGRGNWKPSGDHSHGRGNWKPSRDHSRGNHHSHGHDHWGPPSTTSSSYSDSTSSSEDSSVDTDSSSAGPYEVISSPVEVFEDDLDILDLREGKKIPEVDNSYSPFSVVKVAKSSLPPTPEGLHLPKDSRDESDMFSVLKWQNETICAFVVDNQLAFRIISFDTNGNIFRQWYNMSDDYWFRTSSYGDRRAAMQKRAVIHDIAVNGLSVDTRTISYGDERMHDIEVNGSTGEVFFLGFAKSLQLRFYTGVVSLSFEEILHDENDDDEDEYDYEYEEEEDE